MKEKTKMIMTWIFNKMILVYALCAAAVIGVIWLIGECRLHRRLHMGHRRHKKTYIPPKCKIIKLTDDQIRVLNDQSETDEDKNS